MQLKLEEIPGAIQMRGEFPLLIWEAVCNWIGQKEFPSNENLELSPVFDDLSVQWVRLVCARFAPKYRVLESDRFVIMTHEEEPKAAALLNFCDKAGRIIHRRLGQIVSEDCGGKHAVFLFDGDEDYFRYVSAFIDAETEGEERLARAMLISEGYPHTVVMHVTADVTEASLVHELVHDYLWSLPLPSWLNEGITVTIERDFRGISRPEISRETFESLMAFWDSDTIQDFWSGESFSFASESEVSYKLAEALVDIILRNSPAGFKDFVLNASWDDAGESAAQEYLGQSLGDIAAVFLGEGDWTPRPKEGLAEASD